MLEFISYDGKYPNLCSGRLTFKVDGKEYCIKYILSSGGCLYQDPEEGLTTKQGPWSIDTWNIEEEYPELLPLVDDLAKMVNEHVPQGCCGGCI